MRGAMSRIIHLLSWVGITVTLTVFTDFNIPISAQTQWVTGYYTRAAQPSPEQMNWSGLTHIIYQGDGFGTNPVLASAPYLSYIGSTSDSSTMELDYNSKAGVMTGAGGAYGRLVTLAHAHGVKVILGLGGVYGSSSATNLGTITSDSTATYQFAHNVRLYLQRKGLDGVDVDWENGATTTKTALLMRALYSEMGQMSPRGVITIAGDSNGPTYYVSVLNTYVDQVNLMMYDMSYLSMSCDNGLMVGYDSPLHKPDSSGGKSYWWAHQRNWDGKWGCSVSGQSATGYGLMNYIAAGVSRSRMGGGIPFYGHFVLGIDGPGQTASSSNQPFANYSDAMNALNHGGVYHFDATAGVPYISGTATSSFTPAWGQSSVQSGQKFYYTFDDTVSVKQKVDWAKQNAIGGVMIYNLYNGWVSAAQPPDPLLRAIANEMGNTTPPPSDTTRPTVQLTAPHNGDTLTAGTYTVTATASDNVGVTQVAFLVNGNVASTGTSAPYSFVWNTSTLSGSQTLAARAYDAAGNMGTTSTITVSVKAGAPPAPPSTPVPNSPANGATGQSTSPTLSWNAVNRCDELSCAGLSQFSFCHLAGQ